jgi:hypothetical protein
MACSLIHSKLTFKLGFLSRFNSRAPVSWYPACESVEGIGKWIIGSNNCHRMKYFGSSLNITIGYKHCVTCFSFSFTHYQGFFFSFVMLSRWQSSTKGISQIWLQVREESTWIKDSYNFLITCWSLFSKYVYFRKKFLGIWWLYTFLWQKSFAWITIVFLGN